MPPVSSLAGILDSPVASSNGSTVVGGDGSSTTLPDVSLASLGSSFHSAQEGDGREYGGEYDSRPTAAKQREMYTPGPAGSALLTSPPPSVHPQRRSRLSVVQRREDSGSEDDEALQPRYGGGEDEDALASLTLSQRGIRTSHLGKSTRAGRHSVAGGSAAMTLREQEQNVDALQKENFNLQLENHFLKERLASMAPDHIESALNENVKLKLEVVNLAKELKKCKKLLMQQDRDLAAAAKDRDGRDAGRHGSDSREIEGMWREEKDKRLNLEHELEQLRDENVDRIRSLEDQLDSAKEQIEVQADEMAQLRDTADRVEDELEKARVENRGLGESVGMGRGRENRMLQKLEEENAELQNEIDELRKAPGVDPELEDQFNELRDKFAAAQLDLDRRDEEIEDLNNEIDAKVQDHEKEIAQVEAEWRDEVLEARAHVDELRDVLQEREGDVEDLRKALNEREDELLGVRDRIAELEADKAETHDRLEETLRNIDMDNAEKQEDLVAANTEVQSLGQRVYDLEEMVEELRAREAELSEEVQRADEEKQHYLDLVTALKDARKKAQDESEELSEHVKRIEAERKEDNEHHQRTLTSRDQVKDRISGELEAALDRVAMRDRDLAAVQKALRSLEDERRKIGDERSSDQRSLGLEMERLQRDLARCEDDLDRAREELRDREQVLHDRDIELSELIDKQRDAESKLVSERQGRLALSDKLDDMAKTAKKHEREAASLRERLESIEPLLTSTQNERSHIQKQSEQQRQERTELLLRVFKDLNRFLGTEDNTTPANFGVFRDTLLQRLRAISGVRGDFDKRIKEVEGGVERKIATVKRQLDAKWRALDGFEASVKKIELQRSQLRTRAAQQQGELEATKAKNAELQREVKILKGSGSHSRSRSGSGSGIGSATGGDALAQLRAMTERADKAEQRAKAASATIESLQKRIDDMDSRSGSAENKWEARVKEYESRLKKAEEKVKAEKQGGKERARQLEEQVRDLEKQVDTAKRQNKRAEGVVANAAHLME